MVTTHDLEQVFGNSSPDVLRGAAQVRAECTGETVSGAPVASGRALVADLPPLVGPQELARAFGVSPGALRVMKHRGKLPEPAQVVSGVPIWRRRAILKWVALTT